LIFDSISSNSTSKKDEDENSWGRSCGVDEQVSRSVQIQVRNAEEVFHQDIQYGKE
jgi:hypothetical protein